MLIFLHKLFVNLLFGGGQAAEVRKYPLKKGDGKVQKKVWAITHAI